MNPVTIDFETFGIEGRPDFPPKPVGVSIKYWGKPALYYAWGHPTKNNCTREEALWALEDVWDKDLLFQNGKFDVDVAEVHLGLPIPKWNKIHDTMFLLFLNNPHQQELGLKYSAEKLLTWPATEQDAVAEWLVANQPVDGVRITPKSFGKYIAYAPGDLVGRYANADTTMTEALFDLLYPKIIANGMSEAYDRERRLMPCLLDMERQGVRVDLQRLTADVIQYGHTQAILRQWIIKDLKAPCTINLNSGEELIDAMVKAKKVDTKKMARTKKSKKLSTAKESLLLGVTDKHLLAMLTYRAALSTCMSTFMVPWLKTAEKSGGLIYTTWNQVRADKGARTGRLSSNPNFQNIPNPFEVKELPIALPPLPRIRSYIVPFKNDVLIDRDYSQQEPRILAHFAEGKLLELYNDPWADVHDIARAELVKLGLNYTRKQVKAVNLGIIYGMGYGLLAEKTGTTVAEATKLKKSILKIYPGIDEINSTLKQDARHKLPFRTWGGRQVYCEPPKIVDKKIKTYDYKMLNYLIQGSAADCTKEALIRYYTKKPSGAKVILNVHDELVVSAPRKMYKPQMEVMRRCMESVEFDVPMLSEGDVSETSWDDLKPYDRKGERV